MISKAISALDSAERKPADEMTAFGDFVGSALKAMDVRQTHEAQIEIMKIINSVCGRIIAV